MSKQTYPYTILNIVIDEETKKEYRVHCARHNCTMSEYTRRLIEKDLQSEK